MPRMTEPEWRAFIMEGTRTGKIATVRADGRPHVVPIWFVLAGDEIIFTTGTDRAKAEHLRRDSRVALCVDDQAPLYSFVTIEGTVRMEDNPPDMLRWSTLIGARYMGAERADEFGKRNAVPGELLVRMTITRVIAERDVAGYD